MKNLSSVATSPANYQGGSIEDGSSKLIAGHSGVVFKSGVHKVALARTPPRNSAELEACIEELQAKARKEEANESLQEVLLRWWQLIT